MEFPDEREELPYKRFNDVDFSVITSKFRWLPIFDDDLWLGMQAMNVGVTDFVITQQEYALRDEWIEIEKTPTESAIIVSALSQMWIYGLYEVIRLWRDRRYELTKLRKNGGIDMKIKNLPDNDPLNISIDIRKRQLELYKSSEEYRQSIEEAWAKIEPVFRLVELFRMNLAKHCAPGKDGVVPRAPGYGRINLWCGSMDYELIDKEGRYQYLNRRDIADLLRRSIVD